MSELQTVLLTKAEARALIGKIKAGIEATGRYMLEMQEGEGWRVLGYSSWQACAMAELDFGKSHMYRLLNFAKVERNLLDSPNGENLPLPQTEAQARPLATLADEQQGPAWQQALDEYGPDATMGNVQTVVDQMKQESGGQQRGVSSRQPVNVFTRPYDPKIQAGKYSVGLIDPPWPFDTRSDKGKNRSAENHYPTMTIDAICTLEVNDIEVSDIFADNAVLFLWATWPRLPDALEVIEAWRFRYITAAWVWVKRTGADDRLAMGGGYYSRANSEPCLLAVRGTMRVADHGVVSVIEAPRREHSRKPDEQYEKIDRLYPSVPRIELFARHRREGWVSWGNEIKSQDVTYGPPEPHRVTQLVQK